MSDAECSVVVRDQRALVRGADEPVVPDASIEGEQALSDPHEDAQVGPSAVLFEPELALEGVVDGLDALADPTQLAVAWALIAPIPSEEDGLQFADEVLELSAGVPLVGHDEQARRWRRVLEHGLGDLSIAEFGVGQSPRDHGAVGRGEQVEAQAPEVARVGGAVAVVGPAAESGALDRLPGSAAGHWRRVEQPEPIPPGRGETGQVA